MTSYKFKHVVIDDDEIFQRVNEYDFFSSDNNDLIIHAKRLSDKIMEIQLWKSRYENLAQKIQDMENKNIRLEDEVKNLGIVHGIVDKFGSYKSLQKNCELILFFLRKDRHKARWIEVIKYFMNKGWTKSTIENHLRILSKNNILIKGDLPGEYMLNKDQTFSMDILARWILGSEVYELVKNSWKSKDFF